MLKPPPPHPHCTTAAVFLNTCWCELALVSCDVILCCKPRKCLCDRWSASKCLCDRWILFGMPKTADNDINAVAPTG